MSTGFVPGLDLAKRLYRQEVEPVLRRRFPGLVHTAALIGSGSEVLGFDTERSTDHDWGPRLQLFLHAEDIQRHRDALNDVLADSLPPRFLGYPTNLEPTADGTRHMRPTRGRSNHGIVVADLGAWLADYLGFPPLAEITVFDWLATPTQTLAEITGGAVFHDGLGQLGPVRHRLAWYPDDLWRHVLACQWQRISQEEAFVGRCGEVGDGLGSAIVTARLVRDLMRLCLLIARRYPPYSKWLGSAFAELSCAAELAPRFTAALAASDWQQREPHLVTAYETVAAQQNALGLAAEVDPSTRNYHNRPFRVLHAERFVAALRDSITDTTVRALPLVGAVDQFVDNTDVLCDRALCRALTAASYPHDT
jgi:hypothetical protein